MNNTIRSFALLDLPRGLPTGALGECEEPTLERQYGVMGQPLIFGTNDPRLLEAADQAFGRYPPSAEVDTGPLTYHLFVQGQKAGNGSSLVATARPVIRTRGHLMYTTLGSDNAVVADLKSGYAFGFVSHDLANDILGLRYHLLQGIGYSMIAVCRGYLPLHAACLRKDGVTVILDGSAGAGKSTTAYACLRRGYQFLSEDGLNVQVGPDSLRVWGMPWMLHLLPDSKRFFPELDSEEPRMQIKGEWKLDLDVEARWPGAALTNAEPGLVALMDRHGQSHRPEITEVSLDEALATIGLVWPWRWGWREELGDGLVRLLDGRTFRVRVGGPPNAMVDALDALIEAHGGRGEDR